jgi:chlorophyll synthase
VGLNFPDIARVVLGILMGGPLLCGASQVINDYFDREVDALNQPDRLIPAGLVSIRQVVVTIGLLVFGGLAIGLFLGREVFLLTGIGLVLAIAYSAPPFRGKRNGWVGNSMVAISYEGLAWMAGHLAFASLTGPSVLVALLYSFGSHGIMSINDYKSIEGDRVSGIRTIPVLHGPKRASWLIVAMMNIAQLGVIAAFFVWGRPVFGLILIGILLVQLPVQRTFVKQPTETYLKFSAIGVSFFVWGMMAAAIGLRAL